VAGTNVFARLASDDHATIAYRPRLTLGFTANPAPVIATGSSQSAPAGAPAALTGAASGATTTLWSLVSGPGTATFATPGSPATSVTFSQPGGYVLRFAASNANGSVSRTLGVAVTAPPLDPGVFADWQSLTWPGVADPATTSPQADPDGDGLANFLEWALHLDPKTPGVFNAVLIKNGAVLEYTYTRRKTAAGSAVFLVEWSDTLGSDWSAAGVTTAPPVSINASSETVTATVSAGPGRTRFVRLRVTVP
jgi:PKD domain